MTAEGELQAIVTSVDASEEQSESENPGACGKVKRQQMDHIAEEGYVGSCHCGLVHEPVSIKRSCEDTSGKRRSGQKHGTNWTQFQPDVIRQAKKDGKKQFTSRI